MSRAYLERRMHGRGYVIPNTRMRYMWMFAACKRRTHYVAIKHFSKLWWSMAVSLGSVFSRKAYATDLGNHFQLELN